MQIRWWNSFTILAVILLGIGVFGALSGGRMVFDPGRATTGREWLLYLVAGVLMLVNGLLPAASPLAEATHQDAPAPRASGASDENAAP
jgi:hypothetical protein